MVYAYIITFLYFNPFLMLCPHRSYVFSLDSALQVLYLSLFSPYCPPVCMPASGCQPTRPPGQFFQPVPLVQRHQHRQGGSRGHFLFLLLRHICSERRPHIDPLFVCGHVPGNGACFSDRSQCHLLGSNGNCSQLLFHLQVCGVISEAQSLIQV